MAFLRRDINSMAPTDPYVVAYANAVRTMQARPASDPTSWTYQAAIHGTHAASPPPLADECKHGSWYFLPWHRMYLYWFERIVRAAVVANGGPADWALPYWNYDTPATNTLPEAFRNPTLPDGTPNGLYVAPPNRGSGWNSGSWALPPTDTTSAFAMSSASFTGSTEFGGGVGPAGPQFWNQTGNVEQTPHNDVHSTMSGWMGDAGAAAQDPIFWLHHCNIDRLWDLWNSKGHSDASDAAWRNQSFSFFDENGTQVSQTCADVDEIAPLDYTYTPKLVLPPLKIRRPLRLPREFPWPPWIRERVPLPKLPDRPPRPPFPPGPGPDPGPEMIGASDRPLRLRGDVERVPVAVDRRAAETARRSFAEDEAAGPARLILTVEDIVGEKNPSTVYAVYVNLPEDASEEDLPAHHAGNVSFFGIERVARAADGHTSGLRFAMDITDLAASLAERGVWDDDAVHVTFRPVQPMLVGDAAEEDLAERARHEEAPVEIGRVSVHLA